MQEQSYPRDLMPPGQAFQFVREWFATERGAAYLRWWLEFYKELTGKALDNAVELVDQALRQDTMSARTAREIGGILQDNMIGFMIDFLPEQYSDLPVDAPDCASAVRAVFIHFACGTIHDLDHHMELWDKAAIARARADHEHRQAARAAADKLKGLKDPVLDYDLAERCPEC